MSEVKRLKARVQNKRKTEAEWYLDVYDAKGDLREDAFKPLKGELIIFAADYSAENPTGCKYDRSKFGDGVTNVIALPFTDEEIIKKLDTFANKEYVDTKLEDYKKSEYSKGLAYELNAGGDAYIVIGIGSCQDTHIIFPEEYLGKPVIEIAGDAFEGCNIKNVTIPKTITTIGGFAFSYCYNLREVIIPKTVTNLGSNIFQDNRPTVYCEVETKPDTWDKDWDIMDWNMDSPGRIENVVWGFANNFIDAANTYAQKDEIASNLANGEVEFSVIQKGDNKVYAKNGTAFGYNTIAGSKGYSLAAAAGTNGAEGTYTLNVEPDPSILGKTFSIYLKSNRYQTGVVTKIEGNTITVDNIFLPTGWDQPDSDGDYPITYGYIYFTDNPTLGDVNIGTGAHTEGYGNKAILTGSHSEGANNVSEGKYSHTEGILTYAGYACHAEGRNTKALGEHAHAEGHSSQAIGNQAHAQGHSTKAIGVNSTAGGQSAEAHGKVSEAIGYYATAIGDYSSAQGSNVIAIGSSSHVLGSGSAVYRGDLTKQAIDEYWAANKNITAATGYHAVNLGTNSLAAGPMSTVLGDRTNATGESSMAINRQTLASGKFSFAAGQGTKATAES